MRYAGEHAKHSLGRCCVAGDDDGDLTRAAEDFRVDWFSSARARPESLNAGDPAMPAA